MMKTPAISILIPTYNYARYLPEAIDSVLAQDFDDFELIIADDASLDNTEEICRAYEAKDSRIRFVRHEKNLGMVENWNWCLKQARGTYIKYMLADDKFNRRYALRRLVSAIEKHPDIVLATSARTLIDSASKITGVWNPLGLISRIFLGKTLIRKCLLRNANWVGEPTAVLFRREHAGRGFNTKYRQLVDLEMWFHLLQQGDLGYVNEPLCCFRQHVHQQTAHNRKIGCPDSEILDLIQGYFSENRDGDLLFRQIYALKKQGGSRDLAMIQMLKKQINSTEFTLRLISYRLTKPFQNLGKSLNKRLCAAIYLNNDR